MDIGIVKRHPYATGVVAIFAIIIIYMILKARSAAASASSPDLSGGDTTLAALSSAQSLTDAQTNAQITTAQISGEVANNNINAELAATENTNQTALDIVKTQTTGSVQENEDTQNASVAVATANDTAATQITTNATNAELGVANLEAGVEESNISSINQVVNKLGGQNQLGSKVVPLVEAMEGPQAIAAGQPSQVATANASAVNGPAGILKALNPASIISSLFG